MNRSQPRGFNRGNFGNNSFGGRTSYGSKLDIGNHQS